MSSFVPPSALGFLLLSLLSWGESYFCLRGYRAILIIENTWSFSMVLGTAPVPSFKWLPPQTGQCLHFPPSSVLGPRCPLLILCGALFWCLPHFFPYIFGVHFFFLHLFLCMLFYLHFKSVSHRALQGLELRQRRCLEWDGSHIS